MRKTCIWFSRKSAMLIKNWINIQSSSIHWQKKEFRLKPRWKNKKMRQIRANLKWIWIILQKNYKVFNMNNRYLSETRKLFSRVKNTGNNKRAKCKNISKSVKIVWRMKCFQHFLHSIQTIDNKIDSSIEIKYFSIILNLTLAF